MQCFCLIKKIIFAKWKTSAPCGTKKTWVPQNTTKAVSSIRFDLKEQMSTKLLGKLPPKQKDEPIKITLEMSEN